MDCIPEQFIFDFITKNLIFRVYQSYVFFSILQLFGFYLDMLTIWKYFDGVLIKLF